MELKRRDEIERFLRSPDKALCAALIHGRDMGVVRERAQSLAKAATARPADPFDVAIVSEDDIDADAARLHSELMAISMMGGRRLIRLRLSGDKIKVDRAAAEALSDHLDGKLNPEAFFLIEMGEIRKDNPVRKAAEKAANCAAIACYADEAVDLARFTRDALTADGVGLAADALDLFVSRLPQERGVARSEMERLALFLGPGSGRVGSASDLIDFLGVEPEASLTDAALDAFGGRVAAAYAGLRRAAKEGEGGPAAVRAISNHLAKLRRILVLHQDGTGMSEAARTSGVFWKSEKEFLRQARAWTLHALDTLQPDVLMADRSCKQTGAPADLIGERLALNIAGRARRLGL